MKVTRSGKNEVIIGLLPDSVMLFPNLYFLVLFQSKLSPLKKKKISFPGHLRASKAIFHSAKSMVFQQQESRL